MIGPVSWLSWQLPGGPAMTCDAHLYPERPRLLSALCAASLSSPQPVHVRLTEATCVYDVDHPEYQQRPVTKLVGRRDVLDCALDPERAQLWDILARHYFHAYEVETDDDQ